MGPSCFGHSDGAGVPGSEFIRQDGRMSYYWANLGLHLLISLLWAVKNNQKNRWKRGFLFLLPPVLSIILLIQLALFSIPRVLDSTTVLRSAYKMESGKIERISSLKDRVVVDGKNYYVNPFSFDLKKGDQVIIRYTPYAHYAYSMELDETETPEN